MNLPDNFIHPSTVFPLAILMLCQEISNYIYNIICHECEPNTDHADKRHFTMSTQFLSLPNNIYTHDDGLGSLTIFLKL